MKLYHWTLNRAKLKKYGFKDHKDRHSNSALGVWCTDKITGDPESIKPDLRIVTVDIPEDRLLQYEEHNDGAGYRAFQIPSEIINSYRLEFPTIINDRGVFTEIPF